MYAGIKGIREAFFFYIARGTFTDGLLITLYPRAHRNWQSGGQNARDLNEKHQRRKHSLHVWLGQLHLFTCMHIILHLCAKVCKEVDVLRNFVYNDRSGREFYEHTNEDAQGTEKTGFRLSSAGSEPRGLHQLGMWQIYSCSAP